LGVYQQRFRADGTPLDGEQLVNVHTSLDQDAPSVTGLKDGSWVVTWQSDGQDGSSEGIYQRLYSVVAAFGAGLESGIGSGDNEVFQVSNGGLSTGDFLNAGGGIDILKMIESGTLDLTAPNALTEVEVVQGSGGNDIIVSDVSRLASVVAVQGGAGTDELRLKAGDYDLSSRPISGVEAITLQGTGSITFADKVTALLAHSQTKDGHVLLQDAAFTLAERTQLYNQGIRKVTDASGIHALAPADASLNQSTVQENAATGQGIGILSAIDPNPGDGLRFELIDSAGGRFALSGNQIVVANSAGLDYESATSHRIVVRAIDDGGIFVDKAFTITIGDVPVEKVEGSARADVVAGGAGRDVLYGGLGKDTLTGGDGQDAFVFDTKPNKTTNADRITDFVVRDDSIWLDNKIFTKLGKAGSITNPAALKKGYFVTGKAKDQDDYLIYTRKTGALSYDADGSGTKYKAIEFALLKPGLSLKATDFFVI
jgi:Ca2+-binding RTX toxin-like protein